MTVTRESRLKGVAGLVRLLDGSRGTASSGLPVGLMATLLLVGLIVAGLSIAGKVGNNPDYVSLYAAANLAGTGRLYDRASIFAIEVEHRSELNPYFRIPVFAAALKPLVLMPFMAGRITWLAVNVIALAGSLFIWRFPAPLLAFTIAVWSCFSILLLNLGQDTAFFLLFAASGYQLLRRGKSGWAGAVLSLCLLKYHLLLGVVVLLLAQRRWAAFRGFATGSVLLLVASSFVEGFNWPARYWMTLHSERDFITLSMIPNIRGLASWLPTGIGFVLELGLSLFLILALWRIARSYSLELSMAAALAVSLLIGRHGFVYDAVLLIPLLTLASVVQLPLWLRAWQIVCCTPVPALLILARSSPASSFLLVGFPVLLIAFLLTRLPSSCGTPRTETTSS